MLKKEVSSRFLTIGFSRDHDAIFLNKIAQSGSELGNFSFIDTTLPDKMDRVKECLSNSLSMSRQEDGLVLVIESVLGSLKEKAVLAKEPYFPPKVVQEGEEEEKGDEVMPEEPQDNEDPKQLYDFSKQ